MVLVLCSALLIGIYQHTKFYVNMFYCIDDKSHAKGNNSKIHLEYGSHLHVKKEVKKIMPRAMTKKRIQ